MSILFREIQIGETFGWRGATWTKIDQTHAVPAGADADAAIEHVPSHDAVSMELVDRPLQADVHEGSAAT